MDSPDRNEQQPAAYDIFHYANVMQGLEEANEDDAVRFACQSTPVMAAQPRPAELRLPSARLSQTRNTDHTASETTGTLSSTPDEGFRFESGCRIVSVAPKPLSNKKAVQSRTQDADSVPTARKALICSFPGCESKSTFRGKYELERHHQTRHVNKPLYNCPAIRCPLRFHRPDKLRDHINQGHRVDTCFECQVPSCSRTFPRLQQWVIHALQHRDIGSANVRALRTAGWSCPLPDCKAHDRLHHIEDLRRHLRKEHDSTERRTYQELLTDIGLYHDSCDDCCPICGFASPAPTAWQSRDWSAHIHSAHGVLDEEHLQAWNSSVASEPGIPPSWRFAAQEVSAMVFNAGHVGAGLVTCSSCNQAVIVYGRFFVGMWNFRQHARSMLLIDDDVFSRHREVLFRLQVLERSHPVFDDLRPTVE